MFILILHTNLQILHNNNLQPLHLDLACVKYHLLYLLTQCFKLIDIINKKTLVIHYLSLIYCILLAYLHFYTHIHTPTHKHIHIHTHTQTHIHIHPHTPTHKHIHNRHNTYTYAHTQHTPYTQTHTNTTHAHPHNTHTLNTHKYTYTYTYTHNIHHHPCIRLPTPLSSW